MRRPAAGHGPRPTRTPMYPHAQNVRACTHVHGQRQSERQSARQSGRSSHRSVRAEAGSSLASSRPAANDADVHTSHRRTLLHARMPSTCAHMHSMASIGRTGRQLGIRNGRMGGRVGGEYCNGPMMVCDVCHGHDDRHGLQPPLTTGRMRREGRKVFFSPIVLCACVRARACVRTRACVRAHVRTCVRACVRACVRVACGVGAGGRDRSLSTTGKRGLRRCLQTTTI